MRFDVAGPKIPKIPEIWEEMAVPISMGGHRPTPAGPKIPKIPDMGSAF